MKTLRGVLGVKGLLCFASLTMIALALLTYTAIVVITPTPQLAVGSTSASWIVYVNDIDETRYLPGSGSPPGSAEPVLNTSDPNTYGLEVTTDASKVCAVKIELASAVNSSKFSKFEITAKRWNGSAWEPEILYNSSTGSSSKPYIDGLALGDTGYLHQTTSQTSHYLLAATYSYDLVDEATPVTVDFQYTPLPQDGF